MQNIVYYEQLVNNELLLTQNPPINKYAFDYLIRYKLIADDGYMLYNEKTKSINKVVLIPIYELSNWKEVSFEELKQLDK